MKNFSEMSLAAKSTLAGAALVAGFAGSASEAEAALVSVRVNGIILSSFSDFTKGGKTTIAFLDENEDIMNNLGSLYVNTLPVTNLTSPLDGWIPTSVYSQIDDSYKGSLSESIDWRSYEGDYYSGIISTSVGESVGSTLTQGGFLNLQNTTYTYDNGVSAVPAPAAAYLFATGLPLIAAAARKKRS